jgi:hypothetical protein
MQYVAHRVPSVYDVLGLAACQRSYKLMTIVLGFCHS